LVKCLFKKEAVLFQKMLLILARMCAYYAIKIMIHIPKKSRIAHTSSSQDAGHLIAGCTHCKESIDGVRQETI
jgi:hypothetical protein